MTLNDIYNKRITILNKLRGTDSITKIDVWYKTTLEGCARYTETERGISGDKALIANVVKVMIPFSDNYLPYREWRNNPDGHYTMSAGDYIILGDVSEEITAQNVVKIMTEYGSDKCIVKAVRELDKRELNKVQLYIEGV